MTSLPILGVAALVLLAVVALLLRRPRVDPHLAQLVQNQNELAGRLAQMAAQATAAQGEIEKRLADQQAAFSRIVEERFTKVDGNLKQAAAATQTVINDLNVRLGAINEAHKNLTELSNQVVSLQDILSNKQARGAFGQEQMEAIVRDQLPSGHYEFQCKLSNGRIVDCLIRLPAPLGPLAVDAKFPREAWEALRVAGADKAAQEQALKAFAASIMSHVKDISGRYLIPGETAEHALMFVPSEAVYGEIYASIPEIAEKARRAHVFIVSPNTFWAILNTMRAVMRDARMREQAGEIQKMVGLLLNDVRLLDERAGKLQRHFEQAAEDVRDIRISTERISGRGQRIKEVELDEKGEEPPLPVRASVVEIASRKS
ncbi:MAG TPA: DNA recombination protein RmuC [Alphaproteobacteria bacterium]|nr:DNA recombination protein RmuC [Alphaproteobacteria bacterium]